MIGKEEDKKNYINDKISALKNANIFKDIATTHSDAAHTAYVTGYQHKLTYLLRTIPNIEDRLKKIDEVVRHKFIPAIIGGHIINDAERVMLSLPTRLGGLGLKIFAETAEDAYKYSTRIASNLRAQILGTNNKEGKTRDEIKTKRERRNQQKLRQFLATSDEKNQLHASVEHYFM